MPTLNELRWQALIEKIMRVRTPTERAELMAQIEKSKLPIAILNATRRAVSGEEAA